MKIVDFFKNRWKKNSLKTHLSAIDKMSSYDNIDALEKLAKKDVALQVQNAAISKIKEIKALKKEPLIASNDDSGFSTEKTISEQITEQDFKIMNTEPERFIKIMEKIYDDTILTSIALEAQSTKLRVNAVKRIVNEDNLCEIAVNNCGLKTGKIILNKLTNLSKLQYTAQNASNKKIRTLANEKLEKMGLKISNKESSKHSDIKEDNKHEQKLPDSLASIKIEIPEKIETTENKEDNYDSNLKEDSKLYKQPTEKDIIKDSKEVFNTVPLKDDKEKAVLTEENRHETTLFEENKHETVAKKENNNETIAIKENNKSDIVEKQPTIIEKLEKLCNDVRQLVSSNPTEEQVLNLRQSWDMLYSDNDKTLNLKTEFENSYKKTVEYLTEKADLKFSQLCKKAEEINIEFDSKEIKKPYEILQTLKDIQNEWKEVSGKFSYSNDKFVKQFEENCAQCFRKYSEYQENRDWEMWANLKQKENICKKAEEIKVLIEKKSYSQEQLAYFAQQVRDYQNQWKQVGTVARDENEKIWNRFVEICSVIYQPCLDFKQLLCNKVLEFSEPTDWNKASRIVGEIEDEWGRIGTLPLSIESELRKLFKTNCDLFYENRRIFFQKRETERHENLKIKTDICEQAEKLKDSDQFVETSTKLINLQKHWKKIGLSPKEEEPVVWNRFKTACNLFFERFDIFKAENLILKEQLCQKVQEIVNAVTNDSDFEMIREELINLQSDWKQIGPVPNKNKRDIWEQFHKPCNDFFNIRKEYLKKQEPIFSENKQLLKQFITTAEEATSLNSYKEASILIKNLQQEWKKVGPVFPGEEKKLLFVFRKACDNFFSDSKQHYEKLSQNKDDNLKIKENLCLQAESLVRLATPVTTHETINNNSEISMAEQLNIALLLKDEVNVNGNLDQTLKNALKKIKIIEQQWNNTGQVPREYTKTLQQRFRKSIDKLYGLRPSTKKDFRKKI